MSHCTVTKGEEEWEGGKAMGSRAATHMTDDASNAAAARGEAETAEPEAARSVVPVIR